MISGWINKNNQWNKIKVLDRKMTIIPKSILLIINFVATLFTITLATPGTATFYTKYIR